MMNPAQQTTLQAFVLAMTKFEAPIAPEVEAVLPSIKQDLERQPDHAVKTVKQLTQTHDQFRQHYQAARQELRQHYGSQERDKGLGGTVALQPSRMTRSLTPLSTDFADIAQWVLAQVNDQDDQFCSLLNMRMAVTHGRARLLEFSVLSVIEKRPLTSEDIAYHLEMPLEYINAIIEKLWQAGKIETMGSGLLHKLFPFLKSRSHPNPDAYWVLTSVGHFRLHPIISLRHLGA